MSDSIAIYLFGLATGAFLSIPTTYLAAPRLAQANRRTRYLVLSAGLMLIVVASLALEHWFPMSADACPFGTPRAPGGCVWP